MNKELFLGNLKRLLLDIAMKDQGLSLQQVCYYMETIYQQEDEFTYLFDEMDKYNFQMFFMPDETDGYTQGKILIQLFSKEQNDFLPADHHYEIEFQEESRPIGYCQCSPKDEGFNSLHDCCGENCDWYAPQLMVTRVELKAAPSFYGTQKELWALEENWAEYIETEKEVQRLEELQAIDEQIASLEERKKQLLS